MSGSVEPAPRSSTPTFTGTVLSTAHPIENAQEKPFVIVLQQTQTKIQLSKDNTETNQKLQLTEKPIICIQFAREVAISFVRAQSSQGIYSSGLKEGIHDTFPIFSRLNFTCCWTHSKKNNNSYVCVRHSGQIKWPSWTRTSIRRNATTTRGPHTSPDSSHQTQVLHKRLQVALSFDFRNSSGCESVRFHV